MSVTLAQGNMYSTTRLQKYVTDMLTKDDPILLRLPFVSVLGNSLTYDLVATRSGAQFYSVNEEWVESTVVLEQETASLVRLGGDADVDNFLLDTRSDQLDLQGTVLEDKVLAVKEKFLDTFYYGSTALNAKAFNGLHTLMTSTVYNTVEEGTGNIGTLLNISNLRAAIDLIVGFKPQLMVMSKNTRRRISTYLDSVGADFQRGVDEFGRHVRMFDDIPIAVSDHITDTEAVNGTTFNPGVAGAASSIFILTFAPKAVCGIQGSKGITVVPLGDLQTHDGKRWRVKWYTGLKYENLRSSSHVTGILPTGVVAA